MEIADNTPTFGPLVYLISVCSKPLQTSDKFERGLEELGQVQVVGVDWAWLLQFYSSWLIVKSRNWRHGKCKHIIGQTSFAISIVILL